MRLVLGFIALAALALGVAFAITHRPQPPPWAARLDDEILHAPSNHWRRPALGNADGGHFGDTLESDWDSLEALRGRWEALDDEIQLQCARSLWGNGEPLRPECLQWAADARAKLPLIARATEAIEAGPAPRFDPLRSPDLSNAGDVMVALRIAALDTAIRADQPPLEGHDNQAVDSCLLALAVVRDFEWGAGAIGYRRSETGAVLTFLPCANALFSASAARRARFHGELERIRAGRPPLAHGFALDRSQAFLNLFGHLAPAEVLDRADPAIKRKTESKTPMDLRSLRAGWPWFSAYEDGLVAASSLPPEQRRAAFNALKNDDSADFYKDDNQYFEAYRAVDAVFEGLALFARLVDDGDQHRRWPDPLPQGTGVRLRQNAEGVTLMLDIAPAPIDRPDGGLVRRPNEWFFATPGAWSR